MPLNVSDEMRPVHFLRFSYLRIVRRYGDAAARAAAEFFLRQGVAIVALSLAADGLLLATPHAQVRARPPQVQALNPVGAGDALLAGIAWALERELPLEALARWGVASGTAAAMRVGTGAAPRADIEALYAQVQLEC
jgi:1-phosphofructokinase